MYIMQSLNSHQWLTKILIVPLRSLTLNCTATHLGVHDMSYDRHFIGIYVFSLLSFLASTIVDSV